MDFPDKHDPIRKAYYCKLMATAQKSQPIEASNRQCGNEYDSEKELLQSFSELRVSIHCDKRLAERDNFLKRASNRMGQCKSAFQEKWTEIRGSMFKSGKKSSEEFDSEYFSGINDFPKCCKIIHQQLIEVKKLFNKEHFLDAAELNETERQLLEKEVLLSFYGQYNAGKSTLLNAILHNKFLPMKRDPETSFRLIIQPTCKGEQYLGPSLNLVHELEAKKFPEEVTQNCLLSGDNVLANGAPDVCSSLKELNKEMRAKRDGPKNSDYVLKVRTPLFREVPEGWQVSLMDNPGFDEYTTHVTDIAVHSLKISSACLYLTTYDQYRQVQTANFFKRMYNENQGVFRQRRLIVIVNKLDLMNGDDDSESGNEEEMTKNDVVDKVHGFIKEVCGCSADEIPSEVVIPVSGMWALKARMLALDPHSAEKKQGVVKILSRSCNQPSGEGESPEKILAEQPVKLLTKKLENRSNILELEKRLQEVANSCIVVWRQKIQNDYSRYLETCKAKLCARKDIIEKDIKEREDQVSRKLEFIREIYCYYRNIVEIAHDKSDESPIKKEFRRSYQLDIRASDPKSNGEKAIRYEVFKFRDNFFSKVRNETYGPEDFVEDLKKVVAQTSSNFQETINERCCFQNLLTVRNYFLTKVTSDVSRMATLMENLFPAAKEYDCMVAKESREGVPVLKLPSFGTATNTIQAPNVYGNLLERLLVFCQNAIEVIKINLANKKRSSEDVHDEGKEETQSVASNHKCGEVGVQPAVTAEKCDTVTQSSTKASEIENPDDKIDFSIKPTTEMSTSHEETRSPSYGGATKRSRSRTYRKWLPEMEDVVSKLQESIEQEIQQHFGDNFEETVIQDYWQSYCELAMKRLSNFDDVFGEELNNQTKLLNEDIDQLLKQRKTRDLLLYHASIVSYMRTEFLTLCGRLQKRK